METGCSGESKTGARPLVATSFPYIRDGERGKGQLYQETLDLVSSTGENMLKDEKWWMGWTWGVIFNW